MTRKHILFADNDTVFLGLRTEFLMQAGYHVHPVSTLEQAQEALESKWFHLAILDVRLIDDTDEKDVSGLTLAKHKIHSHIPKIILTEFPEHIDEILHGLSPIIEFLAKRDGHQAMVKVVEHAFAERARFNWDMAIEWKDCTPFSLLPLLENGIEGEQLLNSAEEFEDLFRCLFQEKEHIRIDRLLWQHKKRVSLVVHTFKDGSKPESFIVVCGQKTVINQEAHGFKEFSPKSPSGSATLLTSTVSTLNFAANVYKVIGNDLQTPQTLSELYHHASEKVFTEALTSLFQHTLQEWHRDTPFLDKTASLEKHYRQRLELSEQLFSRADFEKRTSVIEGEMARLGPRIRRNGALLNLDFSSQSFSYPDPLRLISQSFNQKDYELVISAPGTLTGKNILTDESGHTWLTDFGDVGLAPLFWNFVALEAAIRFDWVETNDLHRRHEMELALINTNFAKPEIREIEPVMRKPAHAIQFIRKLAAGLVAKDTLAYHHGIFFHAAHRLARFNPALPLTSNEAVRLAHVLVSMAMIAGKMMEGKGNSPPSTTTGLDELSVPNETAHLILIGDREISLPAQRFELFLYLYRNANRVCPIDELVTNALKGKYEKDYIPTLIGRIRKAIENDPKRPRYLITVPNAGYKLIPKPKP